MALQMVKSDCWEGMRCGLERQGFVSWLGDGERNGDLSERADEMESKRGLSSRDKLCIGSSRHWVGRTVRELRNGRNLELKG